MEERLDEVEAAREAWSALDDETQRTVLAAFTKYDSGGGELAAVRTAIALKETGVESGVFAPLAELEADALEDAARALAGLRGESDRVGEGADDELDRLRTQLGCVEDLAADSMSVVEELKRAPVAPTSSRTRSSATSPRRARSTSVVSAKPRRGRPPTPGTSWTPRSARSSRTSARPSKNGRRGSPTRCEDDLAEARKEVNQAVSGGRRRGAVRLAGSLRRRPRPHAAVVRRGPPGRRHPERAEPLPRRRRPVRPADQLRRRGPPTRRGPGPADRRPRRRPHRANSGGKTTLLETLCQVQLLAQMGLPVPADQAEVSVADTIVFHRRHASFNAGVLESTLRSVVPPVTSGGRTLMLVDEFEAITEPGSAANLLHGLVTLTVERDALGVFVTHLADDLEPLPESARTDGIFAEGAEPGPGTAGRLPAALPDRRQVDAGVHRLPAGRQRRGPDRALRFRNAGPGRRRGSRPADALGRALDRRVSGSLVAAPLRY